MIKWLHSVLYVFAAAAVLLVDSGPAQATTVLGPVTCTVSDVGWDGHLLVGCVGVPTRFTAFLSINCPNALHTHTMDDMKTFQSFAVSALLSGKPLFIEFDPVCNVAAGGDIGPILKLTSMK